VVGPATQLARGAGGVEGDVGRARSPGRVLCGRDGLDQVRLEAEESRGPHAELVAADPLDTPQVEHAPGTRLDETRECRGRGRRVDGRPELVGVEA